MTKMDYETNKLIYFENGIFLQLYKFVSSEVYEERGWPEAIKLHHLLENVEDKVFMKNVG